MQNYKNLWTQVVQPPRITYSEEYQLDDQFSFDNEDLILIQKLMNKNSKLNSPLKCSVYAPEDKSLDKIVIYNHTFNGNKLEGLYLLNYLQPNFAFLLFDSRGCGNNNSQYVTLGLRESLDLDLIISYLLKENQYKEIYLWGRSMGAVAIISFLHLNETRISYKKVEDLRQQYFQQQKSQAIEKKFARERKKYLKMFEELYMTLKNQPQSFFDDSLIKKQRVKFVVLDAPFKDCHEMLKNIIVNEAGYSAFSAKVVLYFFRNSIWNNVKYDVVGNNRPFKKVQYIQTPVLFFSGDEDTLCHLQDLQKMFDSWNSDIKYFRIMEGIDHSAPRLEEDILYCIQQLNEFCKQNENVIKKDIELVQEKEIKNSKSQDNIKPNKQEKTDTKNKDNNKAISQQDNQIKEQDLHTKQKTENQQIEQTQVQNDKVQEDNIIEETQENDKKSDSLDDKKTQNETEILENQINKTLQFRQNVIINFKAHFFTFLYHFFGQVYLTNFNLFINFSIILFYHFLKFLFIIFFNIKIFFIQFPLYFIHEQFLLYLTFYMEKIYNEFQQNQFYLISNLLNTQAQYKNKEVNLILLQDVQVIN